MRRPLSRRDFLSLSAAATVGVSASGWLGQLAAVAGEQPQKPKACILLWMSGGPSQTDTFDPKPDHENGGEFKAIDTDVPGIQFTEVLPKTAEQASKIAVIRSMKTTEGDHSRATFHMRTGRLPQGPVKYPTLGALLAKELNTAANSMPGFVSILPYRYLSPGAWSSGFLGPRHAPLFVGADAAYNTQNYNENNLQVLNLEPPGHVTKMQANTRLELLNEMETDFLLDHTDPLAESHQSAYQRAVRMMRGKGVAAFDMKDEPQALRDAYGRNYFGQGCLLARRLVERGVPFVEVSLNSAEGTSGVGWDTHGNNFRAVRSLCDVLDPAYATLLKDLDDRGLLDSTLVVWMGEFGRTPGINRSGGRDHFPNAWTTTLAGAGVKGGQVIGSTGNDGMRVIERPVAVEELYATVTEALGIDPHHANMSNVGRPIRITDLEYAPVTEVF